MIIRLDNAKLNGGNYEYETMNMNEKDDQRVSRLFMRLTFARREKSAEE
jgi:hypothetical protein